MLRLNCFGDVFRVSFKMFKNKDKIMIYDIWNAAFASLPKKYKHRNTIRFVKQNIDPSQYRQ